MRITTSLVLSMALLCTALLTTACSDEVATERSDAECTDKIDNDGDGLFDCDDPDCRARPVCSGTADGGADGPASPDGGADATSDTGAGDLTADLPGADTFAMISESEPNDGATTTEFNAISVPSVITGTLGKANDADVFSFSAQAGDRLAVQASSTDAAELHLAVFGDAALNVPPAVNAFGNGKDAFAEYYVVKSGTYYIALRDRRNVGSSPAGVGGPTFGYTITVSPLSRAPLPITVGQSEATTISPAGTVRVFSFTAKQDDELELRAKAKALSPASDVDTRLSLFHPGQQAWLGTNDNPSLGETDSLLQGKMPFNGTYHVIVENVADSGGDLRVEVSVDVKAP